MSSSTLRFNKLLSATIKNSISSTGSFSQNLLQKFPVLTSGFRATQMLHQLTHVVCKHKLSSSSSSRIPHLGFFPLFFFFFFPFLFKMWNLLGYLIWHIMLSSILYHLKNPHHLLKFHVGRCTHFCIFKFKDSDRFCVSDQAEKKRRTVRLSLPFCFLRHKHGSIFCYTCKVEKERYCN